MTSPFQPGQTYRYPHAPEERKAPMAAHPNWIANNAAEPARRKQIEARVAELTAAADPADGADPWANEQDGEAS